MISIFGLRRIIAKHLMICGIYPDKKAHDYIIDGVILYIDLCGKKFKVCNEIYMPIAQKYNVKLACVERNIRYVIANLNLERYNEITNSQMNKLPTVKNFVISFSKYIMRTLNIH